MSMPQARSHKRNPLNVTQLDSGRVIARVVHCLLIAASILSPTRRWHNRNPIQSYPCLGLDTGRSPIVSDPRIGLDLQSHTIHNPPLLALNQCWHNRFSRVASVSSRGTGTVQCGPEEVGWDCDDGRFMTFQPEPG